MTYHWDQDADTVVGLPAAAGWRRLPTKAERDADYATLAPRWEPQPLPGPDVVTAARPGQIVKAIAHLAGMVDVWEDDGLLPNLDSYLARRVDGEAHPLAWSRHYRPYQEAVDHAAAMLRHGGGS